MSYQESDAKRLVRFMLYNDLQQRWKNLGRPDKGWIVLLAGPGAPEADMVRCMIGWPKERVLFVDRDASALRDAESKWPGVCCYHGDLADALEQLNGSIAFTHVDLFGRIGPSGLKALRQMRKRFRPWSVFAITYFRGREPRNEWQWLKRTAAHIPGFSIPAKPGDLCLSVFAMPGVTREVQPSLDSRSDVRMLAGAYIAMKMIGLVKGCSWSPSGYLEYQSSCPMTVHWLQVCPNKRIKKAANFLFQPSLHNISSKFDGTPEEIHDQLRHLALSFCDDGRDPVVVAQVLHLERSTVTAWLAHRSRGTYR